MNLYIFNEARRGAVYGVGTYIRELIKSLKYSGICICVVDLFSDKPHIFIEETEGISHWYYPAPIQEQQILDYVKQRELYFHNVVYLLRLYIKDKRNLIFHLNFPQCRSLVEELKNAFDCKVISVVHFFDWGFAVFDNLQRLRNILIEEHPDSFGENLKKSFEEEKLYYSKVDHCICLSKYMQDILCRDYELDSGKVSFIPNGLSDVTDTSQNIKFLRKKWNIQNGEKIILFVGRITEIKGLTYLIKAFHHVLIDCPQSRLVIVGAGDFNRYIKESQNISVKVTYVGLLDKDQLYEWYRLADVGVIPSLFESFGYVAIEMMMHCLPMVATITSGMNEVVNDTCGLKVPIVKDLNNVKIDTDLLAKKIQYLLQYPQEARKYGKNGRKRYEKKYTSKIFRQKMINFYQSLIDK